MERTAGQIRSGLQFCLQVFGSFRKGVNLKTIVTIASVAGSQGLAWGFKTGAAPGLRLCELLSAVRWSVVSFAGF